MEDEISTLRARISHLQLKVEYTEARSMNCAEAADEMLREATARANAAEVSWKTWQARAEAAEAKLRQIG